MIINQKDKMSTRKETIKDNIIEMIMMRTEMWQRRLDKDKNVTKTKNVTRTKMWWEQRCVKDKDVMRTKMCQFDKDKRWWWSWCLVHLLCRAHLDTQVLPDERQYSKLKFVDCRWLTKIKDCWLTTHRIKAKRVVVKWTLPSESSGMFILGKDDDDYILKRKVITL